MDNDSSRPPPKSKNTIHILKVGRNKEGHALAYLNPKDSDSGVRIAGPKAWGGFIKYASLEISDEALIEYIKQYAPNVVTSLKY